MKTPDATHGRQSPPSASISTRGGGDKTERRPSHLDRRRVSEQPTGERIRRAQAFSLRANAKPVLLSVPPWAEGEGAA